MINKAFIGAAIAVFSQLAISADIPQSSPFDNRIQYVNYNAGDVVVVRAAAGLGTRIVFGQNEKILDVASGFSQGWEFQDRANILYIKPKSIQAQQGAPSSPPEAGKWDTNIMVKTNLHLYDFDLHLINSNNSGKAPASRVAYRVEFKYPVQEQAARDAEKLKQTAQAKLDVKPIPKNWDYSMQVGDASENIAPTQAYDDGRFTYLTFPNNRDFPTAFLVAEDKTESLINSHIDPESPDVLVIQRVAREFVLRLGNSVIGIYNENFDPDGIPSPDGTTVEGVKRVLKKTGANNE